MKLPCLVTTDLHLVDNANASYRWDLFPYLAARASDIEAQTLMILGDLTDAKDRHSASLVNQITDSIGAIARRVPEVVLIAGNHDWLLRNEAFFRFLNHIPNVRFITKPTEDELDERRVMFLPYSKTPRAEWTPLDLHTFQPELIFMHQTVAGAIASNGEAMEGEDLPLLPSKCRVYSGDIHVPQTIRLKDGPEVTYVGSPYHVHFGDDFSPRILMLDRRCREHWLTDFKTPRRVSIKASGLRQLRRLDLDPGDYVKVRFELSAADRHQWASIKREAVAILEDRGVKVEGVQLLSTAHQSRIKVEGQPLPSSQPSDIVSEFVSQEGLPGDVLEVGLQLLES